MVLPVLVYHGIMVLGVTSPGSKLLLTRVGASILISRDYLEININLPKKSNPQLIIPYSPKHSPQSVRPTLPLF